MGGPIEFKTDLKLTSAITIIVGSMIGSGILALPADMLAQIPSPWMVVLVFFIAAILTVCGALTFAEMSSMFPRAGGQYHFLKEGASPIWSYLFGWTMFWVIQTGIIAAVAAVFAKFTAFFVTAAQCGGFDLTCMDTAPGLPGSATVLGPLTLPPWGNAFVAISAIVILGGVNYFGAKHGGLVQNITTFAKGLGLLALVVMVMLLAADVPLSPDAVEVPVEGALQSAIPTEWSFMTILAGFGLALAASMFAYDGWPQATYVASEVQNPKKNVPRALLLGPIITAVVYMLVTIAYFMVIPAQQALDISASETQLIAIEAAKAALGVGGAIFISVIGLISVFGTVNGYVLTSPRVFYSLAQDGALVPGMARMNDRGVPAYGLLLTVIWSSLLVMTGLYLALALMVVFGIWLFYIPTSIAHMRMRSVTMKDVERPFRTPLYPGIPIVFLLSAIFIVFVIFIEFTSSAVIASVLILLGVPAYFLQRGARDRARAAQA